jgi:protein subunit release factor B
MPFISNISGGTDADDWAAARMMKAMTKVAEREMPH